jgi:outer membrane protein assembly factor BamD
VNRRVLSSAGFALVSACLPFFGKGKPKPPPPVETVETTRQRVDSLFQAGKQHFRRGKWSKAATDLDRVILIMEYSDARRARAQLLYGEALLARGENLQAVREFRKVADEGATGDLAPEGLLRAADAYAELWQRPELDPSYGETALQTYGELAQRYPGTVAAARGARKVADLQELFANKEFKIAMYYIRYKAYDSAILAFRNLIATYPRTSVVPDALVRLVESYRKVEYLEDLRETCRYAERFYPAVVPRIRATCPPAAADST